MPVTRSGMAANIEAELDTYFALASGNARPTFAAFLANLIADAAQDAVASAAAYAVYTTAVVSVPTLSNAAGPCTGTIANTATTTVTCTIP